MNECHPVPLLLAQLTLRKICEPPQGLSGRLRVEHPNNFSAHILAAILDREVYGRQHAAFESLVELQKLAQDNGPDAIQQLCQALFETASAVDVAAIVRGRDIVDTMLGPMNRYRLYFDAVTSLMNDRPKEALAVLDKDIRENDAIWWQVAAKAHELSDDLAKASNCWDRACQLLPHPEMLNRFAGLSIQQHRYEDALRALKAATVQSPDDLGILEQLALTHTRLRQFAEAGAVFEQLARLQPDVRRFKINLALCQARSGDATSALASISSVVDVSDPDLNVISLRTEILKSLGRADEAFDSLRQLEKSHWEDSQFLILYMDTAYRAGQDELAHRAFQQILSLQHSGKLPEPVLHPMSLDDLKRMGTEKVRHRDTFYGEVVRGKLPWLFAEALLEMPAEHAWSKRTQSLRWLPDDLSSRGEWTVYATNSFSVQTDEDGHPTISRIGPPHFGEPVVVDMSAIITLHRLGHLTSAGQYLRRLILPTAYGDLSVRDAKRLALQQPSREEDLLAIRALVERRLITVTEADQAEAMPLVDEYPLEESDGHFSLGDVKGLLQAIQRLTSQEVDEFAAVCHRPCHPDRELPRDSPIVFTMSTLRTLARYGWLERVLATTQWHVMRPDYDKEMNELQEYEYRRALYAAHQSMWEELNRLRASGIIEFRDSPSCRHSEAEDSEAEGIEPPPFLDAVLLARDLNLRLLADDRLCQASVLNERSESSDAAFGTDRILVSLEANGTLSSEDACNGFLQLMRWRYRFLLIEASYLKILAFRSRDNLPGPELREVAAYVQDSMRDPGLFCGPEKVEPPMSMAFRYFMAWKDVCVEFVALLWEDPTFSPEQLNTITCWCMDSLLPAVPRGMLYSPVGWRLGTFGPKAVLLTAMVRFSTVQPVQRANEALRLMSTQLGLTEDEFYEVAAEVASARPE
jgi:tetratricopeptide (TPR) repeat protein